MPRKNREEEIIQVIREYLVIAVKGLEPITDEHLMKVANCARATFYKYITKDSAIHIEIEVARAAQNKYIQLVKMGLDTRKNDAELRKKLEEANATKRELLAFISRMTANLLQYGVPVAKIQAAQHDAMPHPNRGVSHAGRGRQRKWTTIKEWPNDDILS